MQHLKLIEDQGLDLRQSDILNLYLPALAAGAKNGTLPELPTFRVVCEGRASPKSLQPKWEVSNDGNVIYFALPATDGTDAEGWIKRLELQKFKLTDDVKGVIRSGELKPTIGTVYRVAVLKVTSIAGENRITKKIQAESVNRKWEDLPLEAVCLIRETFSDDDLEAMGLWWIVGFGKPVQFGGNPHFLRARRSVDGRELDACWADPDDFWIDVGGFAFRVPQVQLSA